MRGSRTKLYLLPGYSAGFQAAVDAEKERWERIVAKLEESLSTSMADAEHQRERASLLVDQLLQQKGLKAVSYESRVEDGERAERTLKLAKAAGFMESDPTDDQPFGSEGSLFKTPQDAMMPGISVDEKEFE